MVCQHSEKWGGFTHLTPRFKPLELCFPSPSPIVDPRVYQCNACTKNHKISITSYYHKVGQKMREPLPPPSHREHVNVWHMFNRMNKWTNHLIFHIFSIFLFVLLIILLFDLKGAKHPAQTTATCLYKQNQQQKQVGYKPN